MEARNDSCYRGERSHPITDFYLRVVAGSAPRYRIAFWAAVLAVVVAACAA